jgi:ribosomal-protein-alanine N-acetyltransferase
MALEQQSPAAAHWTAEQYDNFLAPPTSQPPSQRFAWVAKHQGEDQSRATPVLGFLVAHKVDAEWELENIVVSEASRRQGVATLLLGELIAHARSSPGNSIFLEVRETNHGARSLYRKAGFEEVGLRKSYYANPSEDAILCRLRLS